MRIPILSNAKDAVAKWYRGVFNPELAGRRAGVEFLAKQGPRAERLAGTKKAIDPSNNDWAETFNTTVTPYMNIGENDRNYNVIRAVLNIKKLRDEEYLLYMEEKNKGRENPKLKSLLIKLDFILKKYTPLAVGYSYKDIDDTTNLIMDTKITDKAPSSGLDLEQLRSINSDEDDEE